MSPQRYRCTVAYDGTDFGGWQVQPNLRTVQAEIETALLKVGAGETIRIHCSGRTDRGVHARGQVCHFDASRPYTSGKWQEALNGVLPRDICILDVRPAVDNFHARVSSVAKEYRYFLYLDAVLPPDLRRTWVRERRQLDLDSMHAAAALLQGEQDFLSFSSNRGVEEVTTVRNLMRLAVEEVPEGLCVRARADGFMYKMVRQLVGCLLRIGRAEMSLADVQRLLEFPERNHEAPSAPPQGLFLWKVWYAGEEVNNV